MSKQSAPNLTSGLDEQSYRIEDELKIRKVLEAQTKWSFEFTKNDKFAYDLRITQWDEQPQSPTDNDVIGYVELERSRRDKKHSWVTGELPDSWYFLSFLQRKVRDYDYQRGSWGSLKSDFDRTIYLKFNHALDNCFAAPVATIHQDGKQTKWSDGTPKNTYLALDKDHPDVRHGIDDCVEFIQNYFTRKDPGQADIRQWG